MSSRIVSRQHGWKYWSFTMPHQRWLERFDELLTVFYTQSVQDRYNGLLKECKSKDGGGLVVDMLYRRLHLYDQSNLLPPQFENHFAVWEKFGLVLKPQHENESFFPWFNGCNSAVWWWGQLHSWIGAMAFMIQWLQFRIQWWGQLHSVIETMTSWISIPATHTYPHWKNGEANKHILDTSHNHNKISNIS